MENIEELDKKNNHFKEQMYKAFKHGLEYENFEHDGDLNITKIEDKYLPFNEWFIKHYNE